MATTRAAQDQQSPDVTAAKWALGHLGRALIVGTLFGLIGAAAVGPLGIGLGLFIAGGYLAWGT